MNDVLSSKRWSSWGVFVARVLLMTSFVGLFLGGVETLSRTFYRRDSLVRRLVPGIPDIAREDFFYVVYELGTSARAQPRHAVSDIPVHSGPRSVRIAVFGESATNGIPFSPSLSFSRYLQVLLAYRWPQADIQMFNFGVPCMTYEFSQQAAHDSLALAPAYQVFYCGNNDMLVNNLYWRTRRNAWWTDPFHRVDQWLLQRSVAYDLLCDFTATVLSQNGNRPVPPGFHWEDYVYIAVQNFARITGEIIADARRAGVRTVFLTPLRDIRNYPPVFGLESRPLLTDEQARNLMYSATLLGFQHAQLALYFEARGMKEQAKQHFHAAADSSASGCNSLIKNLIRQLPSMYPGTIAIDLEDKFEQKGRLLDFGDDTLTDEIHLNLETHFKIGGLVADALSADFRRKFGPPRLGPIPLEQATLGDTTTYATLAGMGYDVAGLANVDAHLWRKAIGFLSRSQALRCSVKGALGLAISEAMVGDRKSAEKALKKLYETFNQNDIDGVLNTYFGTRPNLGSLIKVIAPLMQKMQHEIHE